MFSVGEAIEFSDECFFRVVGMPFIPEKLHNLRISKMSVLPAVEVLLELVDNVGFDGFLGCLEADAWNLCASSVHGFAACSSSPKGFLTAASAP